MVHTKFTKEFKKYLEFQSSQIPELDWINKNSLAKVREVEIKEVGEIIMDIAKSESSDNSIILFRYDTKVRIVNPESISEKEMELYTILGINSCDNTAQKLIDIRSLSDPYQSRVTVPIIKDSIEASIHWNILYINAEANESNLIKKIEITIAKAQRTSNDLWYVGCETGKVYYVPQIKK